MAQTAKYAGSQYASGVLGTEIITYARYLINEPTASFWNDVEMLRWINEGILDIVTRTWCLGQTEAVTLANDTLEFTLAQDYITVVTVHLTETSSGNVKALLRGHPAAVGHVQDPSEIVYWYEFDNKLGLYPTMSDTSGHTCSCYQVSVPSVISAAEAVPLPAWFDDSLTNFVISKALFKDNEVGTAKSAMQDYEKVIGRYTGDLLNKPVDKTNNPKGK